VDELNVLLRAQVVGLGLREVGERLGEGLRPVAQIVVQLGLLVGDLLLEQRVHHDGRRPRLLQALHAVEGVRQRRRGGDERVLQP
jgi:hypothetical protein